MQNVIRYEVVVKAVVERVEKVGKEWKPETNEPGANYAYTPEIEKTIVRELEIYRQSVDELDLPKLVSVVNNIGA